MFNTIEPGEAHILVVEDNVPNFVLMARMLAFIGVQRCEWKTSGWQVIQFAEILPKADLILMDLLLPYEDGFQVLQRVRAHPRLGQTIVCAVTAYTSENQLRKAKKAGFNGLIGKPIDADRFPSQIIRLLNGEEVWEQGDPSLPYLIGALSANDQHTRQIAAEVLDDLGWQPNSLSKQIQYWIAKQNWNKCLRRENRPSMLL